MLAVTGGVSEAQRLCCSEVRAKAATAARGHSRRHARALPTCFPALICARCAPPQVGTQHMLLALAASRCDAAAALGRAGASADAVRKAVEDASPMAALNPLERMMRSKPGLPPPMAPEAERALAAACRASPGNAAVSAEVLLAAMVRDASGGARGVLDGLGVTPQVRVAWQRGSPAAAAAFGA